MAHRAQSMQALGNEPPCHGCRQPHARGSAMSAVVSSGGEPLGWFCPECVVAWQSGHDPRCQEDSPDGC